ncbi:MAG: TraR/DksA C4-type zinc finger protein [Luteolibacter sp.]
MAAKKTTPKKASASKASAPEAVEKKKAVAKAAPEKTEKKTPAKKATPKAAPAAKTEKVVAKAEPAASKAKASPKKVAVKKSSVVDFPAPAAPAKPPFVPPTRKISASQEDSQETAKGGHSQEFVERQRQRLLDLRDELVDAMSGMTRDTIRNAPEGSEASGSGMHQGDAGSDAYDRDFALSVLAKEQDALYEIEQALRRIKVGAYGICEMSNKKIPQARLEAIPFARLTVDCQAQWEKEYGNRRFRPSNEVGFSGGKYADDEDSESVSLDEDED